MSSERHTEVIRAQLVSKAVLSPDETELYELTQLAGVTTDQQVFKIILDLLKLNVPPVAIIQTLKSMCCHKRGSSDLGAAVSDHSSTSLDRGVSNITLRRGDSSQSRVDVSQQSDGAVRTEGRDHQDRSSRQYRLAQASNSYSQDGSSFFSGKSNRDSSYASSQPQSHHTSDTTFGRNESRSDNSRRSQISKSRIDSYITTRHTPSTNEGNDSYRNRENVNKKSTSFN